MSATLVKTSVKLQRQLTAQSIPPVPWRDPQSLSTSEIQGYIQALEAACLEDPQSVDLRTCLGMAYAVNYDVYKSMDALEAATSLDPTHFWAQLKFAELQYRLRALAVAEKETLKAVDLAQNSWQLSLARRQLQEIRRLIRDGTRNVTWDKPLTVPVLVLSAMIVLASAAMWW
jgi:hypothetical protein